MKESITSYSHVMIKNGSAMMKKSCGPFGHVSTSRDKPNLHGKIWCSAFGGISLLGVVYYDMPKLKATIITQKISRMIIFVHMLRIWQFGNNHLGGATPPDLLTSRWNVPLTCHLSMVSEIWPCNEQSSDKKLGRVICTPTVLHWVNFYILIFTWESFS